jgi:hypothetical protein
MFDKAYGPSSGSAQLDVMRSLVDKHNAEFVEHLSAGEGAAALKFVALEEKDGFVAVAVCTPLMRRAHRLISHSSEIVFMDSSGNMDRQNLRVFLLLTHAVSGGVPLGVLILNSEQTACISMGLDLYNSLLPSTCYGGRGVQGPVLFMTDDCAALRSALRAVYPRATLLLCLFHILQAFWRFLWNAKNGVRKDDRAEVFYLLKRMAYAKSLEDLHIIIDEVYSHAKMEKYPQVLHHLEGLVERRKEWALSCRTDLPVRANNTNNFCESAMRVMKDSVLHRTKAYNVQQLLDFILTRFDSHYERRLVDVANNRIDHLQRSRFVPSTSSINAEMIQETGPDCYSVPSERCPEISYTVNMLLDRCTCPQGHTGGPCKHQAAVCVKYKLQSDNFVPVNDPQARQMLYVIATGRTNLPLSWFSSMRPHCDVTARRTEENQEERQDLDSELRSVTEVTVESRDVKPEVTGRIQDVCHKLTRLYASNPAFFELDVVAFCDSADKLNTDSAWQSALRTFAKYSGAGPSLGHRRGLTSSKSIGVQPTAIARRKAFLGGRTRLHAGRPAKSSHVFEHGYARVRSARAGLCGGVPPSKRKAPHNLAAAVAAGTSLGGTHSAK